jgi:hypothetical protein
MLIDSIFVGPAGQVRGVTACEFYSRMFGPGGDGFVSQRQKGRLMAGGGFNLCAGIIDGETCKLMPVYDRPMHFKRPDDFSLLFSCLMKVDKSLSSF